MSFKYCLVYVFGCVLELGPYQGPPAGYACAFHTKRGQDSVALNSGEGGKHGQNILNVSM